MGHSEMVLAVAGLDAEALDNRTRKLASGDWSDFNSAERAAFLFAQQLSDQPWTLERSTIDLLIEYYGQAAALDVLWWTSRCHYMTRFADAFQIPLESTNVFRSSQANRSQ